jgi:hypothetical protein
MPNEQDRTIYVWKPYGNQGGLIGVIAIPLDSRPDDLMLDKDCLYPWDDEQFPGIEKVQESHGFVFTFEHRSKDPRNYLLPHESFVWAN